MTASFDVKLTDRGYQQFTESSLLFVFTSPPKRCYRRSCPFLLLFKQLHLTIELSAPFIPANGAYDPGPLICTAAPGLILLMHGDTDIKGPLCHQKILPIDILHMKLIN